MKRNELEGYKLVPLQEQHQDEDLNLTELWKFIKSRKSLFLKHAFVYLICGLVIAISSPVKFESHSILLQEEASGSSASELLSKYGGLLGISSLPSLGSSETNPELLPKIVLSADFMHLVLNEPIYFDSADTLISTNGFYMNVYRPPFLYGLLKNVLDLPDIIKKLVFKSSESKASQSEEIARYSLAQMELMDQMRKQIHVEIDDLTGAIEISVEMPDPSSASQLTSIVVKKLTNYLSEYKINKLKRDLDFLENEFLTSKQRYMEAESSLSEAIDRNSNLVTSKSKLLIERLTNERDLRFEIYNSLAQQVEQLKITLNERTPVFQILQKPVFPHERKSPRRIRLVLLITFAGVIVSVGFYLIKFLFINSTNK